MELREGPGLQVLEARDRIDVVVLTGLGARTILRILRDDGAVVHLNGTEVWRTAMPGHDIGYLTRAAETAVRF